MIRPILNNVVVKCFEGAKVSELGIIMPENFYKESNKVKVIAVGNGTKKKPMSLKVGDIGYRVKDWSITSIEENGELFYLMEQDAILALD